MRTYLAIILITASLVVLEWARADVGIDRFDIGQTPVTRYSVQDADGPVVVVAHGFAGSQQMMQGYALPLARAGYRVFVFEFLGHGRHTDPMSGDVTALDGTTRLLVEQTQKVIDAVTSDSDPVALVGHSMASDVLTRVAEGRSDIGPVVLISAFSRAISATTPQSLLLVTGAWEPGLREFAGDALRMIDPEAVEGQTVRAGAVERRAIAAPLSDHVSVLHSRVGRRETLVWLDRQYQRSSDVTILPTGWAILGLLAGIVLIFRRITTVVPAAPLPGAQLSLRRFAALTLLPALFTPFVAVALQVEIVPVLVADYLGLHLLIFGAAQLAMLWVWGIRPGRLSGRGLALLLIWSALFGVLLDRYAANFWPTSERLWIIAVMMVGAVPYMLADAVLTAQSPLRRRLVLRLSFLVSLGIAVALDFESLFFLIMIAPVLVLFYLVFGTMGRDVSARVGPLAAGLVLGAVLAWALGVSFPLFRT